MSKYYTFEFRDKRGTVIFEVALTRDDALARIVQKFGPGAKLINPGEFAISSNGGNISSIDINGFMS